jgi:hypothetical protein
LTLNPKLLIRTLKQARGAEELRAAANAAATARGESEIIMVNLKVQGTLNPKP